jgi:hypothetical protein
MIVHAKYFINDSFSSSDPINTLTSKFDYLFSNQNLGTLDLELWYLRINRRVIKRSEYNVSTSNSPLTSIRVGRGGQPVTTSLNIQPVSPAPSVNSGYDNYTRFINNIFVRHGIGSRFFPMGKNYTPIVNNSVFNNANGNIVGCHLSMLEDFALTFLEKPTDIGTTNTYSTSTIFHIETASPMTLMGQTREYNSPIEFNTLVSPYNSSQILLDQINFFTDRRYIPLP